MLTDALSNIRIVLVGTTHPGNIGAAARAMKTMGLSELHLVQPKHFPSSEASARASGADDILYAATVHDTLEAAVADCAVVIGTSARERHLSWPELDPAQTAERCLAASDARAAMVFGRENSGLSNAELDLCHALCRIPANPEFQSLNLASAVQLVAYECRRAAIGATAVAPVGDDTITADELERFYEHLRKVLIEIGYFDPESPKLLMRRLRRMFNRLAMDRSEVSILRGILSAVERLSQRQ